MTVVSYRTVKSARKPWRCGGCVRKFAAGTSYESQTVKDGDFYTLKRCQTCQGIASELSLEGFDEIYGNDIDEHMYRSYGSWEAADAKFGTIGVVSA